MRTLIALLCAAGLAAADTPSPRDTDPVTRRRAEAALAEHARPAPPVSSADLGLLDRCAAVTTAVQEGEGFLAQQLTVEAGERFLTATQLLKSFTKTEQQALGARWTVLQAAYTALGRALATSD